MASRSGHSSLVVATVSAALLGTALLAGGLRTRDVPGTDEYHIRVREAVLAIPSTIGDWTGVDVEPEASATEILAPVVIMQRRYRNIRTGEYLSMLIVHCGDARNLYGHFPPVCYPNARGWTLGRSQGEDVALLDREFDATNYSFTRIDEGIDRDLSVLNFMISPSNETPVLADMVSLTKSNPSRFTPGLGAAQVQILGLDELKESSRAATRDEFLEAIEQAIRVIAEGA